MKTGPRELYGEYFPEIRFVVNNKNKRGIVHCFNSLILSRMGFLFSILRIERNINGKRAPLPFPGRCDAHAPAVRLDNLLRDVKTKAASLDAIFRMVSSDEFIEKPGKKRSGNTGPRILYGKYRPAALRMKPSADKPLWSVL